ncbi:MAG: acyltransferase domain-containing protein, partial [Actinobacteria bacterium]|nr:acyltransferase domain-containing protein [Actinomycetota bacterium]
RQALANARLGPKDIDAVEAHGTGTTLGDPIEAGALLATYGQQRDKPLLLGSIKSNIGHTQAAAGVAGVIKMTEALRHGLLPKSLHIDRPSTKVEWEAGEVELLTEQAAWEAGERPRRAGISSFGISGTNAHLILEEAPKAKEPPPAEPLPGPTPLVLSAKDEPALASAAKRLAAHLRQNPQLDPTDLAYSLATARSHFEHRALALGKERGELEEALGALANAEPSPNLLTATAKDRKLAYLLTGQGSQRQGMGKELYAEDPLFKEALDRVLAETDRHTELPLKEILFAKTKKAAALLAATAYAQPALFALQVALHESLAKRGLRAELLLGHSVGEIAAAHIAGVFDLPDAARLACARGALMGALPKGGAMAAIGATERQIEDSLRGREAELSLAAVNGPASCVISGKERAVAELCAHWEQEGAKTKRLEVSHAFHSPLIEPVLAELTELCRSLAPKEPQIPVISNLTAEPLSPQQAKDPAYWAAHARQPVRFKDAVGTLASLGAGAYLELGPDPVLLAMARECLQGAEREAALIPTLRQGRPEATAIPSAIGQAHLAGAKVGWQAFFAPSGARRVALPTYPFQRRRYWPGGSEEQVAVHRLRWRRVAVPDSVESDGRVVEIAAEPLEGDPLAAAREAVKRLLPELRQWIGAEHTEGSRLTVLTRNAISVGEGERADLDSAPLWGLVRSAISEHPGRFALIDSDGSDASTEALPAALALGSEEPQIVLREGKALAPRLVALGSGEGEAATIDPERTVLITGATGGLGSLIARHLVERHDARHLLLISRSG